MTIGSVKRNLQNYHAPSISVRLGLIFAFMQPILFLIGCQREGDVNFYISNMSDRKLVVTFAMTREQGDTVSQIVWPGAQEQFIHTYDHYPAPKKLKDCPCSPSVFSLVPGDSSFVILKNINDPENWERRLVNGGLDAEDYTDCYFTIHQWDIN